MITLFKVAKNKKINVQGKEITIILDNGKEFISLTDMLKAKDGDFFISIGFETETQLNIWVFGKAFITLFLIMANSP